jgi:carbamoyl-phosphate synthase large subunit
VNGEFIMFWLTIKNSSRGKMMIDRSESNPTSVLIAGIGGGSLGLEIFKSLKHAGGYRLIGTDVSDKAYGLYESGFEKTYLLQRTKGKEYASQLLNICLKEKIDVLAPGAEEVHTIVSLHRELFKREGIFLMLNSEEVVSLCSDKTKTLKFLEKNGIPVPYTKDLESAEDPMGFDRYPCVVKPTSSSGASNLVFIAENEEEANFFVRYLMRRGFRPTLQEYIESHDEFTVGVLSTPSGEIIDSIAVKRFLEQKLSIMLRYGDRIISSGWSHGLIDDFPEVRQQAERIAKALKSKWSLNIQGRLAKNGVFYPFEVNPRHSGTTYLRTLAGFNEPHVLLQYCLKGHLVRPQISRKGYYLRSFAERYVPKGEVKTRD